MWDNKIYIQDKLIEQIFPEFFIDLIGYKVSIIIIIFYQPFIMVKSFESDGWKNLTQQI